MQLLSDIKYSLRLLRNTPAFTLTTIIIVGLGISLYLTSHTMERVMTDKPLPFPDGDRYVSLKTIHGAFGIESSQNNHNGFTYNFIKENTTTFVDLYAYEQKSYVISDGDYARTFIGVAAEHELMASTGIVPVLGRLFDSSDIANGSQQRPVVISHSLWQNYYNSDPQIIGRISRIDGESATIIGVMPESFRFPVNHDLWTPLRVSASTAPSRSIPLTEDTPLTLVGLINSESSFEDASNEIASLMTRLGDQYPNEFAGRTDFAVPYVNFAFSAFNLGRIMSFISLIILALAIVNLSSLIFIRSKSRQHELAVRSSVGATGRDLAKQVLLESFIVSLLGLLLGILLSLGFASILNTMLVQIGGDALPFWYELTPDSSTVLIGGGFAIAIWLLSGLATAVRAFLSQPQIVLNSGNKSESKRERSTVTKLVVISEVVLSFFLLICCGAIIYLAELVTDAEYSIDPNEYLIGTISLNHPDYESKERKLNFLENLRRQTSEIPGVLSTAISTAPPGSYGEPSSFELEDRDLRVNDQLPPIRTIWVNDSYFESLGTNLVEGREFDGSDTSDSLRTAIIPAVLAQQYWPDSDAIGKRVGIEDNGTTEWLTVVGIGPNILQSPLNISSLEPSIYRPISQNSPKEFFLLTKFDPQISIIDLELELRLASAAVDRNIAIDNFRLLQEQITLGQSGTGMISQIFSFFALLTFALAGIGIYGVIARTISLQTNEIGVRRAIGSTELHIVLRYLKQGSVYLLVGSIVGGSLGSVVSVFTMTTVSDLISPATFMPGILMMVVVLMSLLVFVASYFPSRRAVKLEPGDALRYE